MHLYIHIPFCDSKCGYCAFFSKTNQEHFIAPYFQALIKDLQYQLEHYKIQNVTSIFIGGGTPNFVDSRYSEPLFALLAPLCAEECEITLESNPNLLTKEWLLDLKELGLNRLSLGIQSFYEDKLNLLERQHSQKDIIYACNLACKYIDNVSLDLIYDCALDSKERLKNELQYVLHLGIQHLSAYSLSIDKDSHFSRNNRHDTQSSESFGEFIRDYLYSYNFKQYEVSNFTDSKKCKHNLGYWNGNEYLGVGTSAVGRIGYERYTCIANIESYIQNPLQKHIEILNDNILQFEAVFLGLRSEVGVPKDIVDTQKLAIVCDEKLCYEDEQRIYATNLFLADSLALYLVK